MYEEYECRKRWLPVRGMQEGGHHCGLMMSNSVSEFVHANLLFITLICGPSSSPNLSPSSCFVGLWHLHERWCWWFLGWCYWRLCCFFDWLYGTNVGGRRLIFGQYQEWGRGNSHPTGINCRCCVMFRFLSGRCVGVRIAKGWMAIDQKQVDRW